MEFFESALPSKTKVVFKKLKNIEALSDFYLTGGTALSLQLGHRESEDLDFFTQKEFNPELLIKAFDKLGTISTTDTAKNTLNFFLNDVKLQFLYYPYKLLEEPVIYQNVKVSSVLDIACTKLITISSRGSKKDFVDLFVLLQTYTLKELFENLGKKYEGINYNKQHIIKSLVYFEDADKESIPRLHINTTWEDMKKIVTSKVESFDSL